MPTFNDFLDSLTPPPPATRDERDDDTPVELVVESRTGKIRQAGADTRGAWVEDFKRDCERSLFKFCVGVLGRKYLTPALHKPLCDDLQRVPPHRKLRLYPREHCKTTIVGQGLPLHLIIQPADSNMYFPGMAGTDTRLLLSGETEALASRNLRVIRNVAESNNIFRGLWPHCAWSNQRTPRSEGKAWNDLELVFPRAAEFPEATITARGVGGAITGMHPNVLVKDDLISFEARNSEAAMSTAIEWHKASRGLIEGNDRALEFIIGTRWAVFDLYSYIIDHDPLMNVEVRGAIEDGAVIYPEAFSLDKLDRLRKEFGNLYPLLYLNTPVGAGVTDFDTAELRQYTIHGRKITFTEDLRDIREAAEPDEPQEAPVGVATSEDDPFLSRRMAYLRSRHQPDDA